MPNATNTTSTTSLYPYGVDTFNQYVNNCLDEIPSAAIDSLSNAVYALETDLAGAPMLGQGNAKVSAITNVVTSIMPNTEYTLTLDTESVATSAFVNYIGSGHLGPSGTALTYVDIRPTDVSTNSILASALALEGVITADTAVNAWTGSITTVAGVIDDIPTAFKTKYGLSSSTSVTSNAYYLDWNTLHTDLHYISYTLTNSKQVFILNNLDYVEGEQIAKATSTDAGGISLLDKEFIEFTLTKYYTTLAGAYPGRINLYSTTTAAASDLIASYDLSMTSGSSIKVSLGSSSNTNVYVKAITLETYNHGWEGMHFAVDGIKFTGNNTKAPLYQFTWGWDGSNNIVYKVEEGYNLKKVRSMYNNPCLGNFILSVIAILPTA